MHFIRYGVQNFQKNNFFGSFRKNRQKQKKIMNSNFIQKFPKKKEIFGSFFFNISNVGHGP